MNQQKSLLRISQLLSRFSEQVDILNCNGEFSINIHAENILIGILNVIFDCKLENVNYQENRIYPAIDLRDKGKRLAIQVTASSNLAKIKHTLSEFIANGLYKDYDTLYIYVITKKQKTYKQSSINNIVEGKFSFLTDNIIDKTDLYLKLNEMNDIQKIETICQLLESQFADNKDEYDKWNLYYKGLSEYDQYIKKLYQYVDIKGFSPRVNNTLVKLEIDRIYVPLKFKFDFSNNAEQPKTKDSVGSYDIVTALENYDRLVILGDPGSGKSTSLRYLAYKICSHRSDNNWLQSYVPIIIKAADYAKYHSNTGRSLSEYIIEINKKYGLLFSESLENNKLIILFDGLDEVNETSKRHVVVEKLNSFIAQYHSVKIVVSSRIVGYKETQLGCRFFHFEVEKFSDDQILLFINNWYSSIASYSDNNLDYASQEAEKLYHSIKQNSSVYKLACNPLLITIIALINYQGNKLPEKRVQLYDISTTTLLDNWVQLRNNQRNNVDKDTLIELLAIVAFHIHENYSSGLIPEKELRTILKEEYSKINPYLHTKELRQDINDIVSFLREDAGFLFEKGYDENSEALFGFVHLTFQEYYAAMEFVTKWKEGGFQDSLKDYVYNSSWTEVVKLAASLLKQNEPGRLGRISATKYVADILKVEEILPRLARNIHLVCQILSEDVEIGFDMLKTIIDKLFDLLLSEDDKLDHFIPENCLSLLLGTTYCCNYVLETIIEKIKSDSSSLLSKRLIDVLMSVSGNPRVHGFLLSVLQSDQEEIKECMFEYRTVFPVADIVKTKQFRVEIVKYVNSSKYSQKYDGHLPTQYCCCFEENLKSWLNSINLLNDDRMRKDLIDFYVFSWGISTVDELKAYIDGVKKKYPQFNLERIESKLLTMERHKSLGLDKFPIITINDAEIYKIMGKASSYVVKYIDEVRVIDAPFKSKDFVPIVGEQSASFAKFCNMVINADSTESKEIVIKNSEELKLLIEYSNTIHWYSFIRSNLAKTYALSHLFVENGVDNRIIKWLRKDFLRNRIPVKLEKSFDTRSFEKSVTLSTLDVFDKLVLLRIVNPQFNDKEMFSLAIEEYNKIESKEQKSECESIIYSLI